MIDKTAVIHPSSIVEAGAVIDANVFIGPFCYISNKAKIGSGTILKSHVVLHGNTILGSENHVFQFCSIGEINQDLKYCGEETKVVIGDRNLIREHVTVHNGTVQGMGVTRVGHDNLLMVNTHIAHDCTIGNNCVLANNTTLGGHVQLDDFAIIGGMSAVHQYCIIGSYAMVGGCSGISKDVPPYIIAHGNHAMPYGINTKGLKRHGFKTNELRILDKAYRLLYRSGKLLHEIKPTLEQLACQHAILRPLTNFLQRSTRGIIR